MIYSGASLCCEFVARLRDCSVVDGGMRCGGIAPLGASRAAAGRCAQLFSAAHEHARTLEATRLFGSRSIPSK